MGHPRVDVGEVLSGYSTHNDVWVVERIMVINVVSNDIRDSQLATSAVEISQDQDSLEHVMLHAGYSQNQMGCNSFLCYNSDSDRVDLIPSADFGFFDCGLDPMMTKHLLTYLLNLRYAFLEREVVII